MTQAHDIFDIPAVHPPPSARAPWSTLIAPLVLGIVGVAAAALSTVGLF